MKLVNGIPINLAVMNELSNRVHNNTTQESSTQNLQIPAPTNTPPAAELRGRDPEPTATETQSPPQPPMTEQEPELVSAVKRTLDSAQLIAHKEPVSIDHNAAPGAEGKRIFLPPPIPGFVAGTANVGRFGFPHHISL